jgi:hypothetical protein
MDPLMTNNPLLGLWLGSAHAWLRMVRFCSGVWMPLPRRSRTDARGQGISGVPDRMS